MDPARQVLAQRFKLGVPKAYSRLAVWGNESAQRWQYLTLEEETALVLFLLSMSSFGRPV
ncbi:hypothetical protein B0J11DRAFT_422993 [Dendryphion nanum]|uniref:Uncharacterized protein n=1 Tax=Dendryphion nanum TaxID=256645 RepID=A0A9P9J1H3_9PLEO|nr:hypothetical protein B0J11DRAFT_422993 [Dendryphion nanum]